MAVRSGDDRQVCHRLLQRLALARRAIIGIYFPPIPWPMTACERFVVKFVSALDILRVIRFMKAHITTQPAEQCWVLQDLLWEGVPQFTTSLGTNVGDPRVTS